MKRMLLAFVLVMFSSCVVHAAESSSKDNKSVRANKKKGEKKIDDDPCHKPGVTCIDASGPDESEDSMPAITPKGKL